MYKKYNTVSLVQAKMNVLYFFTLASGASIFDCFGQKTTLKQLNRCLPAQPIGRFKSKTFSLGLTRFQCKRDENFQPKKVMTS